MNRQEIIQAVEAWSDAEIQDLIEALEALLSARQNSSGRVGYIEIKWIRRGQGQSAKLYGPYRYLRYRSTQGGRGVLKSLYLGKVEPDSFS